MGTPRTPSENGRRPRAAHETRHAGEGGTQDTGAEGGEARRASLRPQEGAPRKAQLGAPSAARPKHGAEPAPGAVPAPPSLPTDNAVTVAILLEAAEGAPSGEGESAENDRSHLTREGEGKHAHPHYNGGKQRAVNPTTIMSVTTVKESKQEDEHVQDKLLAPSQAQLEHKNAPASGIAPTAASVPVNHSVAVALLPDAAGGAPVDEGASTRTSRWTWTEEERSQPHAPCEDRGKPRDVNEATSISDKRDTRRSAESGKTVLAMDSEPEGATAKHTRLAPAGSPPENENEPSPGTASPAPSVSVTDAVAVALRLDAAGAVSNDDNAPTHKSPHKTPSENRRKPREVKETNSSSGNKDTQSNVENGETVLALDSQEEGDTAKHTLAAPFETQPENEKEPSSGIAPAAPSLSGHNSIAVAPPF